MAESSVLKEFLILLGVKYDEGAIQKFEKGIAQASKTVLTFAVGVEAMAIAVGVGVQRMASSLEALYFASLRTNTSATAFKAFTRAAQDFGASAGEAAGSIEGLQRFLRNNPAGAGYLDSLLHQVGRSAYDASGHINQTTELLASLGELFKQNTQQGRGFLNTQYANILGIDEKTMLAIQNGSFRRDLEDIQKRLGRAGFAKATADAHRFMMQLRVLGDELLIFGTRIVDVLENKFKISLTSITEWFDRHGDHWADRIAKFIATIWDDFNRFLSWANSPEGWGKLSASMEGVAASFEETYKIIKPIVQWLWEKFIALNDATDGWAGKIALLLIVMKELGATSIIGGVLSLAAAFVSLGSGIMTAIAASTVASAVSGTAGGAAAAGAVAAGGAGSALLAALGLGGAAAGGVGIGWLVNKFFPMNPLARFGNSLGDWYARNMTGVGGRQQDAYEILQKAGASPAQAAAMVKVFTVESGLNPGAIGDDGNAVGIGQWHPDRQLDFFNQFGKDIRRSTMEEQLQFALQEKDSGAQAALAMMRNSYNQADMIDAYVRLGERPLNADEEITKANRVEINQEVAIHVNGNDNPMLTAQAIQLEIRRSNAEMFRNLVAPVL